MSKNNPGAWEAKLTGIKKPFELKMPGHKKMKKKIDQKKGS